MNIEFIDLDTVAIVLDKVADIDLVEERLRQFAWFNDIYETDAGVCVEVIPDWQQSYESLDDHYDELEAITRFDIFPKVKEAAE